MEGRSISGEEKGLGRKGVEERWRIEDGAIFRISDHEFEQTLIGSGMSYSSRGTAIFKATRPVSALAIFTIPSVPAEYSCSPSVLNAKSRQLPLCRFVRQEVSMALFPF